MIWLLVIVIPICIELAGWVVDATFLSPLLKERQVAQAEDFDDGEMLPSHLLNTRTDDTIWFLQRFDAARL